MRPNNIIKFELICRQMWAVLAIVVLIIDGGIGIRVYEGTNLPAPVSKTLKTGALTKKSIYISKRSWNPEDEKGDEKYKLLGKRTGLDGSPTLYKIKFSDSNYMQYLKYIKEIPRLEEYTFCMWYKPENLTHDQTLFSYSLNKDEMLLRFWINGLDSSLRMAIRESPVYKVPTNIREHKWYHICQSWNGVSGEWQVFLDGKRVGSGVLSRYKGTYIPEGGEIILGQDLTGLNKRVNDLMDGEIFGFNLVDEAVPQDQGVFINSQYRPNVQVPPFKKLPPIKKTYQEIKAYISTLPSDPTEARKKSEPIPVPTTKKQKESYTSPKRNRGSQRLRYPPLRKVVVYNREDRQLDLDDASIELNKTKPVLQQKEQTTEEIPKEVPPTNGNYSIHSYRFGEDEKKPKSYEIYEELEDDVRTVSEDDLTNEQSLERKARQNFNLYTARQANKVYTLSSSVKDIKKPKFHFETRTEKPEESSNRRSFVEETKERSSSDPIPVYETEIVSDRKKRSAIGVESRQFPIVSDDPLTDSNGFRRLPQIPDSFINIFTKNVSSTELQRKLDEYLPEVTTPENTNVLKITEPPQTDPPVEPVQTERSTIPPFSPIPARQPETSTIRLTDPGPINFPVVRDFNPRPPEMSSSRFRKPVQPQQTPMERRFDVSSGTDLVMRSYGECTSDRGSPVRDKQHLVVSWADTPVRIFGGAQVESAKNQCGYF